jgi:hypothetical protein
MLEEDVVDCLCGANAWESRGASISPSFSDQSFKCTSCNRLVWILCGYGCGPLALFHDPSIGKKVAAWINGPMMAQWRLVWDQWSDKFCRDARPVTPLPPTLPKGVIAFIKRAGSTPCPPSTTMWAGPYDENDTKDVLAPEDPIFTKHKAYWSKLLAELGIKEYQPTRNRYCGTPLEPWYEFSLHGACVVVGPRKRVDVIEVEKTPPFECPELQLAGKRDNVTVYKNGIHAWKREKFIEYFHIVERALASGPPSVASYDI